MALSNRDRVAESLGRLADGLTSFVARQVPEPVSAQDPATLLQAITEHDEFRAALSGTEIGFAHELLDVATRLSDTSLAFSEPDTQRALDTTERLLRAAGAAPEAEAVQESLTEFLRLAADRRSRKVDRASVILPGMEGLGLKPWRQVIRPHKDIVDGNFNASQFAANLYNVVNGKATVEYRDAVEFFRRTYLTEGLRDLLTEAVRRVAGDMNASPVINLQTNFGGGKTHSMLALYHIFSATPATQYPQGVQDIANGTDLHELGARVHRVVISGQDLPPEEGKDHDGTHINTLWGEIAWQLGGRAAYERLARSDETGTSPGRDVLDDLLAEYSPCVILIDEWVAHARQLYGNSNLNAGTFDAQFTFAQVLMDAVSATPGAMLAVTIPSSDIEVGGSYGQEALKRLQNITRRVGKPWKAATARESFEIVRRRLFEEVDASGLADIDAVARRFSGLYRDQPGEFPADCASSDYADDIRAAYPIHPELFQRLYDDWSTLERFQRTRGVLALMSNVIQVLWDANDASPMIMPSTVPLGEYRVGNQLVQYLDDSWETIINRDVAGRDSTPAQVDRSRPLYGQRSVTERLARTIFIGSAATLKTPNKGIDKQRIWLGTAVPGDTTVHFESALHLLAERATYLYNEGARYWYDVAESVTKTMRDIADGLIGHPERVWQDICRRRSEATATNLGNFAARQSCPADSGRIPDEEEARLVLIHPERVHKRGDQDSAAMEFARDALRNCGNVARRHPNMLVFLAADADRLAELMDGTRDFLAWQEVEQKSDAMNLSKFEQRRVADRRKQAGTIVDQLIRETYVWTLNPGQPDPTRPPTVTAIRTDSSTAGLAERVSDRLSREGKLADRHAPANIRFVLREKLPGVWEPKGYIEVGELWDLYTKYTYMPRLRNRSVLVSGIREALGLSDWITNGFALADSIQDGKYEGLAIPGTGNWFGEVTDDTLLVVPERALEQQAAEENRRVPSSGGASAQPHPGRSTETGAGGSQPEPGPRDEPLAHFLGVMKISGDRYGKALKDLQLEILPHLDDSETELTVTVEIQATRLAGFTEEKRRIVSENARVLKIDPAVFEP